MKRNGQVTKRICTNEVKNGLVIEYLNIVSNEKNIISCNSKRAEFGNKLEWMESKIIIH